MELDINDSRHPGPDVDTHYVWVQDRSRADNCAYYHETGKHNKELCAMPEGYCDSIAYLVSRLR